MTLCLRQTGSVWNLPPEGMVGSHKRFEMFYVYAISSSERNYIYVGLTNNIDRRFEEHNSGNNKTTRAYRPFRLILVEEFETRQLARDREKYLKSGVGKEYLKKMTTK